MNRLTTKLKTLLNDEYKNKEFNKDTIDTETNNIMKTHNISKKSIDKHIITLNESHKFVFLSLSSEDKPKQIIQQKSKLALRDLPHGTQNIHDVQHDDIINDDAIELTKRFEILRAIKLPEQRSQEWYDMRDGKITASDGGTVTDDNSHEPQYSFILKKTGNMPFKSNMYCYHGKKYEEIATLIYEYRMNVSSDEFGLIGHPIYKFLGASPDRICNKYKNDGIHLSKYVGRMLEIKCPLSRKIQTDGEIKDGICPIYYWVQVQLQLECCNLEECDFWQCDIKEYTNRDDFIADTDLKEPFRALSTGFEKGCLIQLIPRSKAADHDNYLKTVYDDAIFLYPPKIEMTPQDCDIWIAEQMSKYHNNPKYLDFCFDKVIYWKLNMSHCVTIPRDREWFVEKLPIFEKMWNYVKFFRSNKKALSTLLEYIDSLPRKINKTIMETIDKLYNGETIIVNKQKPKEIPKVQQTYAFVDDDDEDG